MKRLPLTVISGYLGAGKTTLINRLLAEPHGLRLMVMVNDFGAINIDQSLIKTQGEDVIALTNGCVCCTMGADLFMAIGDALDRRPRPDHLIIEASGVADPKAIANTAIAEPDLSYAGIITLVDAGNIIGLLRDTLVSAQVLQQIAVADITCLTKADAPSPELVAEFASNSLPPPDVMGDQPLSELILGVYDGASEASPKSHPGYVAWHHRSDQPLDHAALLSALENRPAALYRLKGFVKTDAGCFTIQVVGKFIDISTQQDVPETSLVALGPAKRLAKSDIDTWWGAIPTATSIPVS